MTAKNKSQMHPQANALAAASGADSNPSRGFAFPKSARLLKHPSFERVYENGRRHFSTNMTFFYVLRPAPEGTAADKADNNVQIGITVGRALGGAVDRNRIKRRMRDLVRHSLGTLNAALAERGVIAEVVINPKKAALTAEHAALRAEVERGFNVIASAKLVIPKSAPESLREESNSQ